MSIENQFPYRLISGFRPTQSLHLGHYSAVVTDLIREQYASRSAVYVFVADHHARSKWDGRNDFVALGQRTILTVRGLLALGLDPNYCALYRQSSIPELFELMWFFAGLLGDGWLRKGHALKADSTPTVGVYLYPLLMVSDILSLRATHVAIGRDQRQHLELAREIAKKLRRRFEDGFLPVPEAIRSEPDLIPGINSSDGKDIKMAPENGNEIPLFAEEDVVEERIEGIVTKSVKWGERLPADGCNIIRYASAIGGDAAELDFRSKYAAGGYGYADAKRDLRDLFFSKFSPARERFATITDREVSDILAIGNERARRQVAQLLFELRDTVQGR